MRKTSVIVTLVVVLSVLSAFAYIPIIISDTPPDEIIFQKKLYNTLAFLNLFLIAFEYLNNPKNVARKWFIS